MSNEFYFAQPAWFLALLTLLLLPLIRRKSIAWPPLLAPLSMRFPLLQRLSASQPGSATATARPLQLLPFSLMLVLLIGALAQPVIQHPPPPRADSPQAVDLIILLNTSVSMVLKDSRIDGRQVDRMARQIDVIGKLLKDFRGQRIALVILGRPPALWLPLTADKKLAAAMLTRLQTTLGGRNSDISATLQLVGERFPLDDDASANEKIILLSTDAYQQLGAQPPQQAVRQLARRGYRLHTLAIGSTRFAEQSLGKGHLIYQPVDIALLQQLALIGGGKMLRASDPEVQKKLLAALDRSDKPAIDDQPGPITALYFWPLLAALLLLLWQWLSPSFSASRRTR